MASIRKHHIRTFRVQLLIRTELSIFSVLRAYGIGALSYLTPRLLGIILATIRRHKKKAQTNAGEQWKEAKEGKAHRSTGGDVRAEGRSSLVSCS